MTRQITVGNVKIGGGAPVVIQSMLNTKTTDVEASLDQIRQLEAAGCQIVRLAVPNMEGARGFAQIAKESPLPLVADIHFDYKLAIAAAEGGASVSVRWLMSVRIRKSPSESVSMAAVWISVCWKSTAILRLMLWWKAHSSILNCWKRTVFMTAAYP